MNESMNNNQLLPGTQQKIEDYASRVRAGESIDSLGLPPSMQGLVEKAVGVAPVEQEKIPEVITPQEEGPAAAIDEEKLQEERVAKKKQEEVEINRLRVELGVPGAEIEPEKLGEEVVENSQEVEISFEQKLQEVLRDTKIANTMNMFLDGMNDRYKETQDSIFGPKYQDDLTKNIGLLQESKTPEGLASAMSLIADTFKQMNWNVEHGAFSPNGEQQEVRTMEGMFDDLESLKKSFLGLPDDLGSVLQGDALANISGNSDLMRRNILEVQNILEDKISKLRR